MTADEKDLTAGEGVNEASADSTEEGGSGAAGETGALAAASEDGRPEGEYDPSPPLDLETSGSREAKEQSGTGQQSQVGEG